MASIPLPIPGQLPWGEDLNQVLSYLDGRDFVSAALVDGNLVLSRQDGTTYDAGSLAPAINGVLDKLIVNPERFGADLTGVTSSQVAMQAACNQLGPGKVLYIQGSIRLDDLDPVVITALRWSMAGPGVIVAGGFQLGDDTTTRHMRATIDGVRFVRSAYLSGSSGIQLRRVREITVTRCEFVNISRPIWTRLTASTGEHHVAQIAVRNNRFSYVDWAWSTDATVGGWKQMSDCDFTENYIGLAYKGMLNWAAMDGGHVSSNTVFTIDHNLSATDPRYGEKVEGIYIGPHDQLHVTDNNIFGSGREGILLDGVKTATVSGNVIVWPGQLVPSSAIKAVAIAQVVPAELAGGTKGMLKLDGGTARLYTKSATEVVGDFDEVSIGAIPSRYGSSTYRGDTALLTATSHYRHDVSGVTGIPASRILISERPPGIANHHDRYPGSAAIMSIEKLGSFLSRMSAQKTITVTASTPVDVFALSDSSGLTARYHGTVRISAKRSASSSAKDAWYVLDLISGTSGIQQITQTVAIGEVDGGQADDPAFTWSISNGNLRATPIGNLVSGSFFLSVIAEGNLTLA